MTASEPSRLLLDTHVVIWWRTNDARLTPDAKETIAHADIVMVSAASAWEASIKSALGRLELPEPFENGVIASGFDRLSILFEHAEHAGALPAHHHDPFDRMLVAQAELEQLTLVSHDRRLEPYGVDMLWT